MPVPLPPKINSPEKKNLLSDSSPTFFSLAWLLLPFPGLIALIPISFDFQTSFISYFFFLIAFLICIFSAYWISKNTLKINGFGFFIGFIFFTIVISSINAAFALSMGCCISLNTM